VRGELLAADGGYPFEDDFTTGDGPDDATPSVPVVNAVTIDVDGYGATLMENLARALTTCGSVSVSAAVAFAVEPDDDERMLVVQREGELDAFDEETATGAVMDAAARELRVVGGGGGMCAGGGNWADGEPGATETFYIGAIGPNGRFSGWSEPIPVVIPWVTMWSCAATSEPIEGHAGRGVAAAMLAALLVPFTRRRRAAPPT
jgi:hypothetical protein